MKLSEMSTDQATDVLLQLVEPVTAIAEDEGIVSALQDMGNMTGTPVIVALSKMIKKMFPVILKKHRVALYDIIHIMTGKDHETIKSQNLGTTLRDFETILADTELLRFFSSFSNARKNAETE